MKYDPPLRSIELKDSDHVEVTFDNGVVWRPRLWEVGAILSGIAKARDRKFPDGRGTTAVREYIDNCWGKTREEIRKLPFANSVWRET